MDEPVILDANVILRYLLQDHELCAVADEVIKNNHLIVRTEVLCEVVYVLQKVYAVEREQISQVLLSFISLEQMHSSEPTVIARALDLYGDSALDFVDCILIAVNKTEGMKIATFDREMRKILDK